MDRSEENNLILLSLIGESDEGNSISPTANCGWIDCSDSTQNVSWVIAHEIQSYLVVPPKVTGPR